MQPVPSPWSPLAEGETAEEALKVAEAIAYDLGADPRLAPGLSLNQGQTGLALFFAYFERSLGRAEAGLRAQHHLEQAVASLAEQPAPAAGLYHGYTGVAWVTEHLSAGELPDEDEDEDPNQEIDAALLSRLQRSPWPGEIDLLNGLVGWGVYALERLPRPSAAAMLPLLAARLAERTEPAAHGVAWRDLHSGEPDSGMAHGSAGIIALLARMLRESAPNPETASLLEAAVDGVLAFQPEDDTEGDLAWCAGNAGISAALLAAGRAAGREDWQRLGQRLALSAAERYREETGVSDPALCHGTAGLSHQFHRLYRATGDPALLAAARHWLERTLALRRQGQGIGGYLRPNRLADGRFSSIPDPGFLSGAAGIGLALLAAATPVEPAWDRLLLLSGRPDPGK